MSTRTPSHSHWWLLGALVLVSASLGLAWQLFPPSVRLRAPTLTFAGERVTVATLATNHTDKGAALVVSFRLGYRPPDSETGTMGFFAHQQREVAVTLAAQATETISCDFPVVGAHRFPNHAEVQLLSRHCTHPAAAPNTVLQRTAQGRPPRFHLLRPSSALPRR